MIPVPANAEAGTEAVNGLFTAMKKRTNIINTVAWTTTSVAAKTNTFATADGIIYSLPDSPGTACPGESGNVTDATTGSTTYPTPSCGVGLVDVNGSKGPNTLVQNSDKPQDIFEFTIYETKVLPGVSPTSVEAAVMYDKKGEERASS